MHIMPLKGVCLVSVLHLKKGNYLKISMFYLCLFKDDNRKTPSSMAPSRQATSRMTSSSQIEHLLPNYLEILKGMFAFSYIWSFGGHIHER